MSRGDGWSRTGTSRGKRQPPHQDSAYNLCNDHTNLSVVRRRLREAQCGGPVWRPSVEAQCGGPVVEAQ